MATWPGEKMVEVRGKALDKKGLVGGCQWRRGQKKKPAVGEFFFEGQNISQACGSSQRGGGYPVKLTLTALPHGKKKRGGCAERPKRR